MKKRITSVLTVLMFAVSLIGCAGSEQTSETEKKEFVPTPLVIETEDREPETIKQYYGAVKIVTPYKDAERWAGVILIELNGNEAEVTVMDAVECDLD